MLDYPFQKFNVEVTMNDVSDMDLEKLLTVVSHFCFDALEELIPFEKLTDSERDRVMKSCLKSLEVATIVHRKILKNPDLNHEKLDLIVGALNEKDYELASFHLNKK